MELGTTSMTGMNATKHYCVHRSNISFLLLMRNKPHENTHTGTLVVWSIKFGKIQCFPHEF